MEDNQLNLFLYDENVEKIKKELERLREEIEYHNKLYHEKDEPEISDYEYDKLTQKLRDLEGEYPELVVDTSPTQKVGGKTKNIFTQVTHEVQMQSLQDVFEFGDVESFVDKVIMEYGEKVKFCVEAKIDGLSVALEYKDGILVRGATRGDGFVGEDVTENIKMIKGIPHKLTSKDTVTVRGEIFFPRKEFEAFNEELKRNDKKELSNPRNAAAGTMRQLDSELVKERNLSIFVFNIQKGLSFNSHSEGLKYLKSVGIKTIEESYICTTKEEVIEAIKNIGEKRDLLEYDTDGAVVKLDNIHIRDEMGSTIKVPKWAVAYKYPPEQKETIVKDIILQVGRTGQVTPVVEVEEVRVAGSMISKTTLHNFDFLKEKDIRIGDRILIQKAGDVIPEVVKVLVEKRNGTEKVYDIPNSCPVCGEKLEKEQEEVALRCTNSECPAQIYRSITHFVSRDCMDISGMGKSIVDVLIEQKLLEDVADIYYLKYEDILELDRFKEKSAQNVIDAINNTKNNTLDKLIFGLGIRNIGKRASKILAENFDDIYKLMEADVETLNNLEDFGMIMAESVNEFFKKSKTHEIIKKFEMAGINLKGMKKVNKSEKFKDLTICITGTFEGYSRADLQQIIEDNSGKVSSAVSKKTSMVLAGENAGSKLSKAQELNIQITTVEELMELLNKEEGIN